MYGLRKFWAQVVDENDNPVESGLSVSMSNNAVYADASQTALSANPITTTTNGVFEFWTAATTVDVIVSQTAGGPSAKLTMTPGGNHKIVLPQQTGNILEQSMPLVDFFDDFLGGYVTADRWTIATDAGGTVVIADQRDGVAELLTGATDEDGTTLSSTDDLFIIDTDKNLFFEARIRCTETDSTNYDSSFCVGLSTITTVDLMQDAGAGPADTHDGILFFKVEANKFLEFETSNAAVEVELSDMLAFATDTWYRVGFKVDYNDGVTAKVTPYINGKAYATCDLTISGMVAMNVVASVKTHGTQTETLDIDYIRVVADRDD